MKRRYVLRAAHIGYGPPFVELTASVLTSFLKGAVVHGLVGSGSGYDLDVTLDRDDRHDGLEDLRAMSTALGLKVAQVVVTETAEALVIASVGGLLTYAGFRAGTKDVTVRIVSSVLVTFVIGWFARQFPIPTQKYVCEWRDGAWTSRPSLGGPELGWAE